MTKPFKPDKYQTQKKRSITKQKNATPPSGEPKTTRILCPWNIFMKAGPKNKVWLYTVFPSTKLDLNKLSDKLNEYFPCKVTVSPVMFNLFNAFDVVLEDVVTWQVVHDCTLKALEALEGGA